MNRLWSTGLAVLLCVAANPVFAAPQGNWGNWGNHNSSSGTASRNWGQSVNRVLSAVDASNSLYHKHPDPWCHHPQGPTPVPPPVIIVDPVRPAPPPVIIVDPVRPVPPVVRDHRQPPAPVVRDHRNAPPVVRDHRQTDLNGGRPLPAPRVVSPSSGASAQGGVKVTNSPNSARNGNVENLTGSGPVDILSHGLSAIGSSVIDFFTPNLGVVPPNRDQRTATTGTSGTGRDHR